MSEREKLIEIINDFFGCDAAYYDINPLDLAIHLLANGVRLEEKQATSDENERLVNANALRSELAENLALIHLGPYGYCACSPKIDGELVLNREYVLQIIDSAPTVDARPVVHGRWLDVKETEMYVPDKKYTVTHTAETCSNCKVRIGFIGGKQYLYDNQCPNCGAKMERELLSDGEEETQAAF